MVIGTSFPTAGTSAFRSTVEDSLIARPPRSSFYPALSLRGKVLGISSELASTPAQGNSTVVGKAGGSYSAKGAGKVPKPDIKIGKTPRRKAGTIRAWIERGGRL